MKLLLQLIFSSFLLCYATEDSQAALSTSNETDIHFGTITKSFTSTVKSTRATGGSMIIKDNNNGNRGISITFENIAAPSNNCPNSADTSTIRLLDFTATYGGNSWTIPYYGPHTRINLPNPGQNGKKLEYGATVEVSQAATVSRNNETKNACIIITIGYSNGNSNEITRNRPQSLIVAGAPMILNENTPMSFGEIMKPTTPSKIVLQPSGAINVTNGNSVIVNSSTVSAGQFSLRVEREVTISVSGSGDGANGGLSLTNLTLKTAHNGSNYNLNPSASVTTNPSSTSTSFSVGATLNVASSVAAGDHNVGYTLVFNYQ